MEQINPFPVPAPDQGGTLSVYQSVALNILTRLDKGSLSLVLPSGEERHVGDRQSHLHASIHIVNPEFFRKVVLFGDVGFGEAYVDGDWETESITNVVQWFILNMDNLALVSGSQARFSPVNLVKVFNRLVHLSRPNTVRGSRKNIAEHYDLSNEFYRLILDPTMTYSSGVFTDDNQSLADAQREKYDRLCRKLRLKPSDHVLEIGCGWGGFAEHAVKNFGVRVTAVTISKEQYEFAEHRFRAAGLSDRITLLLADYRQLTGEFDKIVSIEMLEAVGHEFLESYFAQCHRLLRRDGLLGLQVITSPDSRYETFRKSVDWIQKHIFPGSLLPSIAALNRAVNKTGDLTLHSLEEHTASYAKTLALWRRNFQANLQQVKALGFNHAFIRKWNYYLSYCEAAFLMRNIGVMQLVYTRPNNVDTFSRRFS
ncbi:MAG: cyclopropane-fatty-acyl-phospholipid synthase family protein [Bacteroidota bacterium]